MKKYRVIVASYSIVDVETEDVDSACEIALDNFEATNKWVVADVEEMEEENE